MLFIRSRTLFCCFRELKPDFRLCKVDSNRTIMATIDLCQQKEERKWEKVHCDNPLVFHMNHPPSMITLFLWIMITKRR